LFKEFADALANPPPRVAVSLRFVARSVFVAAGLTAFGAVGVVFATTIVPVLMWGRHVDAGALVVAQVHVLLAAVTQALAYAQTLLSF